MAGHHQTETTGIAALSALLDAEREALLLGDLEGLAGILPRKEALIDGMNAAPPPDAMAARQLGQKVRRNQMLLDGVLDGLRSAVTRISVLKDMQLGMDTYGADGQKRQITTDAARSVERRA